MIVLVSGTPDILGSHNKQAASSASLKILAVNAVHPACIIKRSCVHLFSINAAVAQLISQQDVQPKLMYTTQKMGNDQSGAVVKLHTTGQSLSSQTLDHVMPF